TDDSAGDIGAGYPHYRAQGTFTYGNGPVRVYLREQYIGGGIIGRQDVIGNSQNPTGQTLDNNSVPATWYTDLHSPVTPSKKMNLELYSNTDTLLAQAPPLVPSFSQMGGTGPTNLGLYDQIGRRMVLGAHLKF